MSSARTKPFTVGRLARAAAISMVCLTAACEGATPASEGSATGESAETDGAGTSGDSGAQTDGASGAETDRGSGAETDTSGTQTTTATSSGGECEMCGGDVCVFLDGDPLHCGMCGNECPADGSCVSGECTCSGGLTLCDGACANTQANPDHCGGCGEPCGANDVCNMGVCSAGCDALLECDGGCVDPMTDPAHCGGCGEACANGEVCVDGMCGCSGESISYAAEIEPIFVAECTGMACHAGVAPSEGLDLGSGQGYAAMVGVSSQQCANRLLVSPGSVGDSYLVDKLLGSNLCFGSIMPKQGSLPAADIQAVTAWICGGAAP